MSEHSLKHMEAHDLDITITPDEHIAEVAGVIASVATVRYADTVNELRLLIGSGVGSVAVLGGYATRGDGGGGMFFWDDGAAADDGGTILNAGGIGSSSTGWRRASSGALDVRWFGADGTGQRDSAPAFAAAWAAIKLTGGRIVVPPGIYQLNATWQLDIDHKLLHNYEITGYGAQLLAGPDVTGHAIQIYRGCNNFGVKIEGFHFNHLGNTTVNGCIQSVGAVNLRVIKCSMEAYGNKTSYAAIELDSSTYWALIDGFSTRQRSGGQGSLAAIGVHLIGGANATKIMNCSFGSVVDAIRFDPHTNGALANGVNILHNDFEGITNAVTINTALPATYMVSGLHIAFNRVESTTTFFNIVGAPVHNHSHPPVLESNYLMVGSVTNYILNPNNQYVFSMESSSYGVSRIDGGITGGLNCVGGPQGFRVITEGAGRNLEIKNLSGGSSWKVAHLVLGAHHLWVDTAGNLRIKHGVPQSDNDGVVVGSQN